MVKKNISFHFSFIFLNEYVKTLNSILNSCAMLGKEAAALHLILS